MLTVILYISTSLISSLISFSFKKDPNNPFTNSSFNSQSSVIPGFPSSPYMVLSTDYHSYSLVYSCSQYFGLFHVDFAWILARTPALTADVIGRLHEDLATSAAAVDAKQLIVTDQTGCDIIINWPLLTATFGSGDWRIKSFSLLPVRGKINWVCWEKFKLFLIFQHKITPLPHLPLPTPPTTNSVLGLLDFSGFGKFLCTLPPTVQDKNICWLNIISVQFKK